MTRQPGSAFKPFVYLTAVEHGYMPHHLVVDAPIIIPDGVVKPDGTYGDWKPENFSETFEGPVTLRYALAKSINVACVRLFSELDGREVIHSASQMGISTPLSNVYSLALGSSDVTLIDIVSAYSAFPNDGIRVSPNFITRIEDRDGTIIEENATDKTEVLSPRTSGIMRSMLSSVVDFGTSEYARLIGLKGAAAGKTGTTNNCTDAWFIGFTTEIVAGAWVGYDDYAPMGKKMTGARMALPIWTRFVLDAGLQSPVEKFKVPEGFVTVPVCAQSGELATEYCTVVADELFEPGDVPRQRCSLHGLEHW